MGATDEESAPAAKKMTVNEARAQFSRLLAQSKVTS